MVIDRIHSRKFPNSIVLQDASWNFYRALLREYDEQPSRINYDRGTLEVMTLSIEHERFKMILGEMIGMMATLFRMRMTRGGSSTLKRMAKKKGLEADQCYWLANEPTMRTKKRIDLRSDPPPDLVVEIDIMHAVVNRENIYATLGVPEMWVLRRDLKLSAFSLNGGKWRAINQSLSFPFLRVAELNPFIARIGVDDDTSIVADFKDWCEQLKAVHAKP